MRHDVRPSCLLLATAPLAKAQEEDLDVVHRIKHEALREGALANAGLGGDGEHSLRRRRRKGTLPRKTLPRPLAER